MRLLPCLCAVGLFMLGCGDSGIDGETGGSGGTGAGGGSSNGGGSTGGEGEGGFVADETYTVSFPAVTVAAGEENTQCIVVRLGNDHPIHVHQIQNSLPNGSHHLIVYRTNDTEEQPVPFDCDPFVDTLDPAKGSPLMITQKHEETLTLPDGVAFTLAEDILVRLEMHYINPAVSGEIEVSATSTFSTMPDASFENEADFLFIGNPDITIDPHSTFTLGPTYFPLPANLAGSKFFGFTGHTHQWGTNVTVAAASSETGDDDVSVYDVPGWQWSEPATVQLDPPYVLPEGGGFRFTCEWDNMSDQTVEFGESANAEMCFFWAYYYPSQGAFVCAHTDQFGGYNACCPGDPACDFLF